jgi:PAS domain S-box-containing protein
MNGRGQLRQTPGKYGTYLNSRVFIHEDVGRLRGTRSRRRRALRYALRLLVGTLGVYGAGVLGFSFADLGGRVSFPFLSSGVAVAVLARWGLRLWPAVLLGTLAIDVLRAIPLSSAVGIDGSLFVGYLITALILRRARVDPNFPRRRDVSWFVLAATVGMAVLPTTGLFAFKPIGPTVGDYWFRWWFDGTIGVLLVAPFLAGVDRRTLRALAGRIVEVGAWLALLLLCVLLTVTPMDTGSASQAVVLVLSVPLVVWSALRFGLVVTALASCMLSASAFVSLSFARGAFAQFGVVDGLLNFWCYAAMLAVLGLMIATLLAERDEASAELRASERRYESLFAANPYPAYVWDHGTMRFLVVNDAAVRKYGYSREEFLGMGLKDLRPPEEVPVLLESVAAVRAAGIEESDVQGVRYHRTKDGQIIDVEITRRSIDFEGRAAELVYAIDATERRRLQRALLEVATDEQRRLGQELHDGLGQELTALAMNAHSLASREPSISPLAPDLARMAQIAGRAIKSCRSIARGLSPLSDTGGGLIEALRDLAERTRASTACELRFALEEHAPLTISWEARNHLLRIAQEAIGNALKHARPKLVQLRLEVDPELVRLTVRDDGVGFKSASDTGLGIETMRYRAASVGARLRISAAEGGGMLVSCELRQALREVAVA